MPGVNLNDVRVAAAQPSVGTERRERVSNVDYGGLLATAAGAVKNLATGLSDKREQEAALAVVDESLRQQEGEPSQEGVPTFQNDPVADEAGARATAVEEATGLELDAGDRGALTQAAQVSRRVNDAQSAHPTGERRFNLIRTRELRKLIADRPHLAKEFRSLLYGDNNFLTAAMDSTDAQAALEAKARHESISKVRDMLVMWHPEVANLSDAGVLDFYSKSGYAESIKRLDDTKREAGTYKAMYEAGTAINDEDSRRIINAGKAGFMRTTMSQLDGVLNNPTLDPASKARAIDQIVLNRRLEIQTAMPWRTATQIAADFKDVLEDIPALYRGLASEGPERKASEDRLAIIRSNIEQDLETRYGKSTVEFTSRVVSNLQSTGVLTNYDTIRDSKPMQQFLGALAAGVNGDNPPAPRLSKRNDKELAQETEQNNAFVKRMLGGFDKLDEDSRRATAHMVVSAINHPDNRRSDAGMDRLMVLMASPDFKPLAQSPEWQDTMDGSADRAIGVYLTNLDRDVGKVLSPLEGKVSLKMDEQGVLVFEPAPGLASKDRDALARLQNRLRNVVFANANLHNQTPAEATRDFYDTYLAK